MIWASSIHGNTRVRALLLALVMLTSTLTVLASFPSEADEDGTPLNPVIIAGNNLSDPYELETNGTYTTYIGFNKLAFADENLNAKIRIATARDNSDQHIFIDESNNIENLTCTYESGSQVSVTLGTTNADLGLYSLTFTANGTTESAKMYDFRITVTCTYTLAESQAHTVKSQSFIYRAYVQVVDSPSEVIFSTASDSTSSPITSIQVVKTEEMTPVYPYVDGDRSGYCFYAHGLPDGISMLSDGTISGKIAGYVSTGNYNVDVYAIHDQSEFSDRTDYYGYPVSDIDPAKVYRSTLEIEVLEPAESFGYIIGSGTVTTCSQEGYTAIAESDSLTVKVVNADGTALASDDLSNYTVKYTANGIALGPDLDANGSFSITFDGYTGIVQVIITNQTGSTALIHVMVVGQVVHTGLAISASSS